MLTALYVHIPFCKQICTYCDFHKEMATFDKQSAYMDALVKELVKCQDQLEHIETIFIGGGTPSSLSLDLQEKLFQTLSEVIDISVVQEFSIESNPNDISKELVTLWKQYGINRVSVGVQTFNPKQLQFLNRSHHNEDTLHAIQLLKEGGIENISIDLIFSLINQTVTDVTYDVTQFLELDIDHISYYSLILEEKTKLMYLYDRDLITLNSEDIESDMYNTIIDVLQSNGYHQYEISNFTRHHKESLHNTIYWTNKEYLGVGSGAHSLKDNKRFYNVASVAKYTEAIMNNTPYQTFYPRDEFYEECIMGLRLMNGIDMNAINQKYQLNLLQDVPSLEQYVMDGYLEIVDNRLKFTRKGLMIGNLIFGLFMEVKGC